LILDETDRSQMGYYFSMVARRRPSRVSIPDNQSRKGDRTRQRIIERSAPLLNQKGYAGCSLQDIMAAAGVEKGGIYRHFASKQELALATFDFAWAEVYRSRTHGLEGIDDPLLRIEAFIRNFADRRPALPGGCPLLNTAIEADDGNAALRGRAQEALDGWRGRLSFLVSSAVRQGSLKRGIRPDDVASLIIGTLEGALMISRLDGDRAALKIARDHLISYLESHRYSKRRTAMVDGKRRQRMTSKQQ
jgi:TetR/AcrR family transcriptional regulator, transcriptional repressor for nem operon